VEQFGRFEEVAELLHGFFLYGFELSFAGSGVLVYVFVPDVVFFQQPVGVNVHFFGQVLVKHESEDIVAELIGVHFAAQGIGNVSELGFELSFLVGVHGRALWGAMIRVGAQGGKYRLTFVKKAAAPLCYPKTHKKSPAATLQGFWRRRRDSNPRYPRRYV